MVNVSMLDRTGAPAPRAAVKVAFELTGPGALIGVGNRDPNSHEADKAMFRTTYNGWAQAIVQTEKIPEGLTGDAVLLSSAPRCAGAG